MPAIEDHVYNFIKEAVAAAAPESPLAGVEVHDTVYREIEQETCIRVGDGDSDLAPNPGATAMQEFDGVVPLVVLSLLTGADRSARQACRSRMIDLSKALAMVFMEDPTMGGRVNDSRVTRWPRGWDNISSRVYSVSNAALLVNETGGQIP